MWVLTSLISDRDLRSLIELWRSESTCSAVEPIICFRSEERLPKVAQNKRWKLPNTIELHEDVRSFLCMRC
jgi:hypothetical protein